MIKNSIALIKKNWKSGFSVGLVSIPLAISLAVASNTTPVVGIITAIWSGFVASIFGGSNYNIIGPTGALTGILAGYAIIYGPDSLSMLAILAGIIIFITYFINLEKYLVLFPASTIHGFILGIAIIIILNQINPALGISVPVIHENLLANTIESIKNFSNFSAQAASLFFIFLFFLFFITKKVKNIPAMIIASPIAIFLGYLSTSKILPLTLQTLETKYSTIQPSLFLRVNFSFNPNFLIPAFTIALIAIIETMISARIADGLTKTKHDKQKEILGLSLANIVSGICGGIPATAALARTDLNIRAGGTSKISATLSSFFILIISFLFLKYFKFLPIPAVAAMLAFVAIRMVEKKHLSKMYKIDKKNFALAMFVAAMTIYEDPIIGILSGVAISMFLFMLKLSQGQFELSFGEKEKADYIKAKESIETGLKDSDLLVYSIKGKLAYINAQSHITRLETFPIKYNNILLNLKDLYFIDMDGVDAFSDIINIINSQNKKIFISGVSNLIEKLLENSNEFNNLKKNGFVFENKEQVIKLLKNQ
ncbi:MAG: SulP family inorganic anion transporter [Candidatus Babeliales bacterium]